ncbi:uncharacterized protein PFL1_05911 [Pseudozyma flocculosa PF-1]|uniref:Hypervirulence associated protein TUDOR domain-containing protein n=1 Tax=Pseudozyma flocculosa PF-1 TaxID=1277687 RepID=A0A061H3V6_9BASI|nr:uncharacterized protein PFL1_05911 [Pseudozyma flocculosa PF-1]EPQ26590.1 hypothetical protein PFL1_05911 [Pseudozyma flocculosa PF-1]
MTLNVGDRVLFNVGRGAEEGIVQGFHKNHKGDPAVSIAYTKRDGDKIIMHRLLDKVVKS